MQPIKAVAATSAGSMPCKLPADSTPITALTHPAATENITNKRNHTATFINPGEPLRPTQTAGYQVIAMLHTTTCCAATNQIHPGFQVALQGYIRQSAGLLFWHQRTCPCWHAGDTIEQPPTMINTVGAIQTDLVNHAPARVLAHRQHTTGRQQQPHTAHLLHTCIEVRVMALHTCAQLTALHQNVVHITTEILCFSSNIQPACITCYKCTSPSLYSIDQPNSNVYGRSLTAYCMCRRPAALSLLLNCRSTSLFVHLIEA